MSFWPDFAFAFLLLASLASLGRRLLARLGFRFTSEARAALSGLAAGSILFTFGVLLLGFIGWIRPLPVGIALAVLLAAALPDFGRWLRGLREFKPIHRLRAQSIFIQVLVLLALGTAAANLISADTPPVTDDELSYHLYGPQYYARSGYWRPPPVDHYPVFYPQNVEMFYAAEMLFRDDIAPALTHFLFGMACAGLVALIALRVSDGPAALLAAIVFTTMPRFASLAHIAYTDFVILLLALAAFDAYLEWRQSGERRWILLSLVLISADLASKFSALSIAGAYALLYGWDAWRLKRPLSETAGLALFAGSCTALFFLPWFARNLMHTGNPIYPFPLPGHPGDGAFGVMLGGGKHLLAQKLAKIALLPHYAMIFDFSQGSGPALMLFPLALLVPRLPDQLRTLFLFVALHCALSILLLHDAAHFRYILMSHALIAVAAGFGIREGLARMPRWAGRGVQALLLLAVLIPGLAFPAGAALKRLPYALGRMSREEYLRRFYDAEGFDTVSFANRRLPQNAKIWMIYGDCARPYYYDGALVYCNSLQILRSPDYAAVRPFLDARGVTHILFMKYFGWRKNAEGAWELPGFYVTPWLTDGERRGTLVPVFDNGKAVIYRRNDSPDASEVRP